MQRDNVTVVRKSADSLLATHKVLRNTYMLLGLTFLFSALCAYYAMVSHARPLNFIILIAGMYGLMFLTQALRNSPWGLVAVFAFTGFLGYTLGPILNLYLTAFQNGGQIIMTALGATGIIFFSLSAYVLVSRKDFSYLGGFLFVGVMFAMLAMLASFLFQMPALSLAVSGMFVLISSGLIMFQTSMIIQGGERNYIMATVSLFVSIYNLFVSLLNILAALSGRE